MRICRINKAVDALIIRAHKIPAAESGVAAQFSKTVLRA